MGYVDSFDQQRRQAAEARAQHDAELRETRADQAALTEHAQEAMYGSYQGHRAHFNTVVHSDLTNHGITNGPQIAAQGNAGWRQDVEPALRQWEAVKGYPMPEDVFKAIVPQRPGPARLSDGELEKRHETLVEMESGSLRLKGGQVREELAELQTDLQKMPEVVRLMNATGAANSPWAARQLLHDRVEHARGNLAQTAKRSWLTSARAAASGGSILGRTNPPGSRR